MEFSGVIEQIGEGVSKVAVGERVFGLIQRGAIAEEIAVSADELSLLPAHLSFAQAAAIPVNYLTAAYGLSERAALRAGEILLVLGAAGGTGTAAIKIGKMMGALVIAAASTEEKRSFACAHGADGAIDYTHEAWREALKSLTNDRSVDVIFDVVGGEISPVAFRSLGWRGQASRSRLRGRTNPSPSVQHSTSQGSIADGSRQRSNSEVGARRIRSTQGQHSRLA
jgi:NADPH2:quinone reductase